MTAVRTPATMEELAETWSTTSSVNVKMGGKEKLATPVSSAFPKHNRRALFGCLNLLRCIKKTLVLRMVWVLRR